MHMYESGGLGGASEMVPSGSTCTSLLMCKKGDKREIANLFPSQHRALSCWAPYMSRLLEGRLCRLEE